MMLHEVTKLAGAHKRRKRVGRGEGSGHGKTCGRGNKGDQARSGGGARPLTEGGQMPLFRRLPKRGFSNFRFRTRFEIVNVGRLNECFEDGATVDIDALKKLRLVRGARPLVRILGDGKLEKRLTVTAHVFSEKARRAIEQAGGKVVELGRPDPAAKAAQKRRTAKAALAAAARRSGSGSAQKESS
jgi:large subunit ribosomal protein L15